jgi:putative membrane protein
MLVRDALLAYAHFLAIFLLASLLAGELLLFGKSLSARSVRVLQIVDRWYGGAAGLVIATGLSRLFFGLKGAEFYAHNPIFWTKMALFGVVALLSIPPTVAYIKWNARKLPDGSITLDEAEFVRLRAFLWAQLGTFLLIPLCATFMARGL